MARRGRKPKPGKREPNGQLSRKGFTRTAPPDRGTEWVQTMRAKFGPHYNWALGRAYAAGLLNDPVNPDAAKERYETTCRFVHLHGRVYGTVTYGRNPLDDSPRGSTNVVALPEEAEQEQAERDENNREWLRANEMRADHSGGRPFLDQMLSSLYVDGGPTWLDRLIDRQAGWERDDPKAWLALGERDPDRLVLDAAIKAIDAMR